MFIISTKRRTGNSAGTRRTLPARRRSARAARSRRRGPDLITQLTGGLTSPALSRTGWFHQVDRLRAVTAYDLVAALSPATRQTLISTLALMFLPLAVYLYIFSPNGYLARHELLRTLETRRDELSTIAVGTRSLRRELTRLGRDSAAIETIARDDLKMVRPGETVYRLRTETTPAFVLNVPTGN